MSALSTAALPLVKFRLNRLSTDTSLDTYLTAIIGAAEQELTRKGITLADNDDDKMLLVEYATWRYLARDTTSLMPPWLALRIRERWISEVRE